LIGGMGIGHGELIKFLFFFLILTHAKSSSLSNRRNVQPCRGPAFLRQFTIRHRVRPCEQSRVE
jgi:hypothetical protein